MKKIGIYILITLIITILIPTIVVTSFNFSPRGEDVAEVSKPYKRDNKKKDSIVQEDEYSFDGSIIVYNTRNQQVHNMPLEEYVKGVVAAEMPGEFPRGASRSYRGTTMYGYTLSGLFNHRRIRKSSC